MRVGVIHYLGDILNRIGAFDKAKLYDIVLVGYGVLRFGKDAYRQHEAEQACKQKQGVGDEIRRLVKAAFDKPKYAQYGAGYG